MIDTFTSNRINNTLNRIQLKVNKVHKGSTFRKWFLSFNLKVANDKTVLIDSGRLFYNLGPATVKARSISVSVSIYAQRAPRLLDRSDLGGLS